MFKYNDKQKSGTIWPYSFVCILKCHVDLLSCGLLKFICRLDKVFFSSYLFIALKVFSFLLKPKNASFKNSVFVALDLQFMTWQISCILSASSPKSLKQCSIVDVLCVTNVFSTLLYVRLVFNNWTRCNLNIRN